MEIEFSAYPCFAGFGRRSYAPNNNNYFKGNLSYINKTMQAGNFAIYLIGSCTNNIQSKTVAWAERLSRYFSANRKENEYWDKWRHYITYAELSRLIRTIEESDGFIRDIQKIGKFGTVRIDRVESSHPAPDRGESSQDRKESSQDRVESSHPTTTRLETTQSTIENRAESSRPTSERVETSQATTVRVESSPPSQDTTLAGTAVAAGLQYVYPVCKDIGS